VLSALGAVMPFLDRNLLAIDSPHDGLPPDVRDSGAKPEATWRPSAESMAVLASREQGAFLGVCGVPSRTDVRGLIVTGTQTVPGLGEEGEMLSALSVARIVTRTDRTKERLRRELWSKVET
jgi:hypothetical protein